jgi:hypothetical protein
VLSSLKLPSEPARRGVGLEMTTVNVLERVGGKLYQFLFRYRELYENRFEAIVGTLEIFLIGIGLLAALDRFLGAQQPREMSGGWEMGLEFTELGIFLLLLLTALSRLFVTLRRGRLGYSYGNVVTKIKDPEPDAIMEFYGQMKTVPLGHAPGLLAEWPEQLQYLADKIAHQTASLLSERSWFFRDEKWRAREQDSLSEWFGAFPASLWNVRESHGSRSDNAPAASGYYSVMVPMTPQSARSIRKGQRATDLAELDKAAVAAFALDDRPGSDAAFRRVDLLAYLHIYVPFNAQLRDETRLLAVSIQHLSFLLYGMFGSSDGFVSRWNFTVLCESSNRGMNLVLKRLGFMPVVRERDGSETQAREARSYAGFRLFELKVDGGSSEHADARQFLVLLKSLVLQHAASRSASKA